MSREEDALRATTRAIAATVRDVPPLELEPAPGELWSPGRGPRRAWRGASGHRLRSWLTPVAAAAVVVAVAIALVIAKGPQNGGPVPQPPLTNSGPGGVPRYYVALDPVVKVGGFGLLVGDTLTGQTLAVINPPAHMSYGSVTAAADDRTFVAFAANTGGSNMNGRWYILHLAPGTAHVVSLTSTPIHPQSGVRASALSGSGTLLAVAENGPPYAHAHIIMFSVATGRPLRIWSSKSAPDLWNWSSTQDNQLTWIDGDRAIAFSDDATPGVETVRRLNVGGSPGAADLIADSQPIWSATAANGERPCGAIPPLVSADGHTIGCPTAGGKHSQLTIAWRGYQASALAPAAGKYTTAYQLTRQVPDTNDFLAGTLWISPSGSALIGVWTINLQPLSTTRPSSSSSASATPQPSGVSAGIGVMSHGTFTPLRLAQHVINPLNGAAIAW